MISSTARDTLTYNGKKQALVTAGTPKGGKLVYAIGDNKTTAPSGGYREAVPKRKNSGTYYVWYKVLGDAGQEDSEASVLEAVILRKPVTLKWGTTTFTYDGKKHAPKAEEKGLVKGDICKVSVKGAATKPGTYTAKASKLSNANYSLPKEKTVTFTIEQKEEPKSESKPTPEPTSIPVPEPKAEPNTTDECKGKKFNWKKTMAWILGLLLLSVIAYFIARSLTQKSANVEPAVVEPQVEAPVEEAPAPEIEYAQVPGGEYKIVGTRKTHVMKAGDYLAKIAREEYGDKEYAKYIIVHNDFPDPDNIPVDMEIKLPELERIE